MGKRRRSAAVRAALVVGAALACLVALLFLPPVQAALAKAVAERIGVGLELGSLHATPWGVRVDDLQAAGNGFTVTVERIRVDIGFWASLAQLKLVIDEAILRDTVVRVTRAAPRAAIEADTEPRPVFAGIGQRPVLPSRLAIRRLVADGTVEVVLASTVTVASPWELRAADVGGGAEGTFELSGSFEAREQASPLAAGGFAADATATIGSDGSIRALDFAAEVVPTDPSRRVRAAGSMRTEASAERYELTFDRPTGEPLANVEALLDADGMLEARWDASVAESVASAFARGRPIPDVTGTSRGRVELDQSAGALSVRFVSSLVASGWDVFDPRLAPLGELRLNIAVDGGLSPDSAFAEQLDLDVDSSLRDDLLSITALQPLELDTETWLVEPRVWRQPAVRVHANRVPLYWLRGYSAAVNLEDSELTGTVLVVRDDVRQTTVVALEPLEVSDVGLDHPVQGVAVPTFDVTLEPRLALADGRLEAEIEQLAISADNGLALQLEGQGSTSRADWPRARFAGSVTANVPALERIMPQLAQLSATASLQLDFETLELTVSAADLGAYSVRGDQLLTVDFSSQQPLRMTLPALSANWSGLDPESITLALDRMPLDWLGSRIPEIELRGGVVSGNFTATGGLGQGLQLATDAPITIENLVPLYRGRPVTDPITASVRPRLVLGDAASSFALDDLRVQTPGGGRIEGRVLIDAAAGQDDIAVAVTLVGEFPTLSERLGVLVGPVSIRQNLRVYPDRQDLTVQNVAVEVGDTAGATFFRARNVRPFTITAEAFSVVAEGAPVRVLEATLTPIALERLSPRVAGFDVEGLLPEGRFYGTAARDGRLVFSLDEPLVLRDVSVNWGETTLLDRITAELDYEIAYSEAGIEVRYVEVEALDGQGETLLQLSADAVAPVDRARLLTLANAELTAHLSPLASQPLFAGIPRFTSGTLDASLELDNAAQSSLRIASALRGAATESDADLPDIDLELDVAGVRRGRMDVALPIRMESRRFGRSDLRLDGTLDGGSGERPYEFTAALSGEQVAVADAVKVFELLLPQRSNTAPARGAGRTAIARLRAERHTTPVWTDRLSGTATLELDRLTLPSSLTLDALHGRLELGPQRLAVTEVGAAMLDARLDASLEIGFDASAANPYSLDLTAAVDDLEIARLFHDATPDAPPTAEGNFDIESTLIGTGRNPLDLALSTLGRVRVEGRDGVFRGLAASTGAGSTAARVAGLLTFSRELRAVGRIIDDLGEIRFTRAEAVLERPRAGELDLDPLLFVAPQVQVQAAGTLAVVPNEPLVASPLDLSVQLSARGDVALLFDAMDLLEEDAGPAGYRRLTRSIHIGGSPAEPDTSAFWERLEEGADNARGTFGFALRRLNRHLEKTHEGPPGG